MRDPAGHRQPMPVLHGGVAHIAKLGLPAGRLAIKPARHADGAKIGDMIGRIVRLVLTDERTTRHPGYGMSQSRRAMVECIFGWGKQHGTMRKTKHRGIARVAADFLLNLIAYNLIRIPKLLAA